MSAARRNPNSKLNHGSLCQDLTNTQTFLETLRAEQCKLLFQHFAEWRQHRKSTIATVAELQKKIDAVSVGCNVAQGAGALAGIGAFLVGSVLEMKGYKSAGQFIRTSRYCTVASTATLATSSLLEFGLTRSSMNEIERVMKRDVEQTEILRNWIQWSHEAESLFYQLFQCNIASTTFANIMKAFGYCFEMLDAGLVEVDDLIRDLQSCEMGDMDTSIFKVGQKVLKFLEKMRKNPRLLTPMKAICRIYAESPDLFEFVKLATDIYWKGYQMMQSGPLSVVLSLSGAGCPQTCNGFKGCVLNAAGMAFHVVTFILAVKNIQEGKSKYSESLDKLKAALNLEMKEVTEKMRRIADNLNTKEKHVPELRGF